MRENREKNNKDKNWSFGGKKYKVDIFSAIFKKEREGPKIKMINEKEEPNPDKTELRKIMSMRHSHYNKLGKKGQIPRKIELNQN